MSNRRHFLKAAVALPLAIALPVQASPFEALMRLHGLPPGLLDQLWAAHRVSQDMQQRMRHLTHQLNGGALVD